MSVEPTLHVLDDPGAAVAGLLAAAARAGEAIVLTGGRSVEGAYEQAAALEPDWSRASVWWGDERAVPPDDEHSNFLLAKRSLLDRLEHGPEVHRIRGELDPEEAAAAYDRELEGVALDLVLLGVGSDGHIASLFPGSPQLAERGRRVAAGPAGLEPYVERVTMTLPTLLSARRLVLVVTGAGKADAVARGLGGEIDAASPVSLLRSGSSPVDAYLDAAAAAGLAPRARCAPTSRRRPG